MLAYLTVQQHTSLVYPVIPAVAQWSPPDKPIQSGTRYLLDI